MQTRLKLLIFAYLFIALSALLVPAEEREGLPTLLIVVLGVSEQQTRQPPLPIRLRTG